MLRVPKGPEQHPVPVIHEGRDLRIAPFVFRYPHNTLQNAMLW